MVVPVRRPMPADQQPAVDPSAVPNCPKCQGAMWDNRENKRNPRAPDFKCKNAGCDGVIWPPRDANAGPPQAATPAGTPDDPACPVCGGKMWDDRLSKRNPRAPDFKCRNKPKVMGGPGCPGIIWPPREGEQRTSAPARGAGAPAPRGPGGSAPRAGAPSRPSAPPPAPPARDFTDDEVPDFDRDDDDLPF
jgi:hypothetical protein